MCWIVEAQFDITGKIVDWVADKGVAGPDRFGREGACLGTDTTWKTLPDGRCRYGSECRHRTYQFHYVGSMRGSWCCKQSCG